MPTRREIELLALVIQERTGREVAEMYRSETGRRMPYGTLYTTFSELERRGWVRIRQDTEDDRRVRWIRISSGGAAALERARDEHARLEALAREAMAALKPS